MSCIVNHRLIRFACGHKISITETTATGFDEPVGTPFSTKEGNVFWFCSVLSCSTKFSCITHHHGDFSISFSIVLIYDVWDQCLALSLVRNRKCCFASLECNLKWKKIIMLEITNGTAIWSARGQFKSTQCSQAEQWMRWPTEALAPLFVDCGALCTQILNAKMVISR